jgi:heme oxygenase
VRQAHSLLPQHRQAATRYLSHGAGLPLWQTFLEMLENSLSVQGRPHEAVAGANATFELFLSAARFNT